MKSVGQLTQFYRFEGTYTTDVLLMFFLDGKYYVYDPGEEELTIDSYTPTCDKLIGEYNIEIAKFIVGLYSEGL